MTKITGVTADYNETLPIFGAVMIIHLKNEGCLFLPLESKASDPAYDILRDDKQLFALKTDGDSIYWPDGPRLMLNEIMEILRESGEGLGQ